MRKLMALILLLSLAGCGADTSLPGETASGSSVDSTAETVIVEVEKEPETAEAPVTEEADPGRFEIITEKEVLILPEACDFTKLTVISGDGKLRDNTALADVPHHTELYVESWTLSDISPIGGLTELTDLTLAAGTTNRSPLAGLESLEKFRVGGAKRNLTDEQREMLREVFADIELILE